MFDRFRDNTRIWIYGFRKDLDPSDKDKVVTALNGFISDWHSHKVPVKGEYIIVENRFVIIAAEEPVSGCSIDSSVAVFKDLQQRYHLDALDFDLIFYHDGNQIRALRRDEFRMMVRSGQVSGDTDVFDLTLSSLHEVRAGKFRIPFSESWHWQVFRQSA